MCAFAVLILKSFGVEMENPSLELINYFVARLHDRA
jgi:hypothetical protein